MATSAAWVELLGTASTVASEPVWDQNLMEPETQNNPEIPRSRGALWGKLISVFFLKEHVAIYCNKYNEPYSSHS